MKYLYVVVRDQNGRKLKEHPCPAKPGRITLVVDIPEVKAVEHSVQLTASSVPLKARLGFLFIRLGCLLAYRGGN